MLVSYTREEQLFESLAEIAVTVTYPHEAVLDDVGHDYLYFCLTFYPYSMRKGEMLHGK